jgi:hypothetical protein
MTDEYDDLDIAVPRQPEPGRAVTGVTRRRSTAARLVARAYRAASEPLRARMLACLLQPLSTLSLVAVASGAFGSFVYRDPAAADAAGVQDLARYSGDQVLELARFVQEVNPDTLQRLVQQLADSPVGLASFSASAIVVLYRGMRAPATRPGPPVV